MLRLFISSAACAGLTLAMLNGCGSTTTVNPPSIDAGCEAATLPDGPDASDDAGAPPNGEQLCPTGACNYQTQSGCSVGTACRPQFSASSTAVAPGCEPAGAGKSGAVCASGADCAAGFYCAEKACRKQCCGSDSSVCDAGDVCFRSLEVDAAGQVEPSGMSLCFPTGNCDVLDASSCGAGQACAVVDSAGRVACIDAAGAAGLGEACSSARACAAGASCVGGACRPFCRALACGQITCTADQGACIHFSRDPAGVGECTPE